jgi:hypothetical protein
MFENQTVFGIVSWLLEFGVVGKGVGLWWSRGDNRQNFRVSF